MKMNEYKGINLHQDGWFSIYHAKNLTPEFLDWWFEYYGTPDILSEDEDEKDAYWIRCAFALTGWMAGRRLMKKEFIVFGQKLKEEGKDGKK